MNFDIKKDTVIELIKKTIESDVTKCQYYLNNDKIDDVIVKRKNKIIELKKVSSSIFIEDFGQDVGPIAIEYLPTNHLRITINNDLLINIKPIKHDIKKDIIFKKFNVKFLGVAVPIKYQIIINRPVYTYCIILNNKDTEYKYNKNIQYFINEKEFDFIIDYYKTFKTTYDDNELKKQENEIISKLKEDLIKQLELNKIEIKLD